MKTTTKNNNETQTPESYPVSLRLDFDAGISKKVHIFEAKIAGKIFKITIEEVE